MHLLIRIESKHAFLHVLEELSVIFKDVVKLDLSLQVDASYLRLIDHIYFLSFITIFTLGDGC